MKLTIVKLLLVTLSYGSVEGFVSNFGRAAAKSYPSISKLVHGDIAGLYMSESPSPEPSDDLSPEQDQMSSPPSPRSEPRLQGVSQSQKKMDPLVRSLTRTDPQTANAPTTTVPFLGELALDKTLFVLLPVAGFAVLGFLLSVYVALGAGDAFVALQNAAVSGRKTPIEQVSDGCRGICSSQDQDLEGLRQFMSSFSKK
mmetsp:Transcript_13854/g.18081  ORF Transcript_13854/g.18081 Transcript_13854/m.18081 type:complete len:199 (+) Transcript_13854:74-670(+)|eukprot:CAMPEP_0198142910 /NCGR_PEP_ID=MMETSP1443-20131203/5583_1 /TAXON_ID=186043 /ORGANISM="Entomoneis sp., Strain CCMP2396" /LENGTH=198 /DNA_ID=CAMNT_0043806037 /DNA_START=57 /DNA_END=653 /DNA_ORIENTATION=+